jgi:hypothetical protein
VVVPLVLIFIGAVFLLENTGYLPPNFWVNLWRLWPLLLVLAGIELLLAHRIPWLVLAGLAAVVLILGAFAVNSNINAPVTGASVTQSETDLGSASQAAVTVRFGAGQLNIGPLAQPRANQLASMTYNGPPDLAPQPNYTAIAGGLGRLDYQVTGRPGPGVIPFTGNRSGGLRMDLSLAPEVPITSLIVQTGATEAHLDLSSLRVSNIDMSLGAATATIRLPENAGLTTVHISGGASTIFLEVPQGVAARIQHRGGLSTLNVDRGRFPLVSDGVYRSADYDTASNKVDVNLETGVTTIQVS